MAQGVVVWFTGLSGAGKSTLATLLAAELRRRAVHVEVLDGDEMRERLSSGLGFSREDRDENVKRIGFVAGIVARCGACAIVAAISPYRAAREGVRQSVENFFEVYVECPLVMLTHRDPKGLYRRAISGEIANFTGVTDPYEPPEQPDVHVRTDAEAPEESLQRILEQLERSGLVAGAPEEVSERSKAVPYEGAIGTS